MRPRGFALLIVLWTLVLIALLVSQINAGGRGETQLAGNLRGAARLEAMADGAVNEALFHLLDRSPSGWRPGATVHRLTFAGGSVEVRIGDEAGRVNPSNASNPLLQALLRAVGADTGTAEALAASIVEWRTPYGQADLSLERFDRYRAAGAAFGPSGAPFVSFDELGAVYGMTPDLLARLVPHLTLYTDNDPDPTTADAAVLAALTALNGGRQPSPGAGNEQLRVVSITASASGAAGTRFTRHAIARLIDGEQQDSRIVTWDTR